MRREASVRTPPPVRSKGGPGGARQASPRVLAIAGIVVAVIVAAVVAVVLVTRGGNNSAKLDPTVPKTGSATWKGALPGSTDVRRLFKGIPEQGLVLGSPSAPAQLTEFIDLQCPVCQAFETQQLPTLVQKYVRPGKLSIKMEPWDILDRGGHDSARGQAATIAASLQNRAFQFAEMLYLNQGTEDTGWLTDHMVQLAAASVDGVDVPRVLSDASSSGVKSVVSEVDSRASRAGFNSTPTLLLNHQGKSPQVVAAQLPNLSTLESQIDSAIAG
jgi:protein-disulfide isomerase